MAASLFPFIIPVFNNLTEMFSAKLCTEINPSTKRES